MTDSFPGKRPKWKIIDAILILISIIVLGIVSKYILAPVKDDFTKFFLATILQASILIFGSLLSVKIRGNTLKTLGLTSKQLVANFFKGLVGGFFLLFIIIVVGVIIQKYYNQAPPPQDFEGIVRDAKSWRHLIIIFLAGSILAPVSEEIFFRGFVYPVLRLKFGYLLGLIVSGIFFGVMHFDLFRVIPLSFGGMGLAWLYEKTNSLVTPMVAHAVWNSIMTVLIVSSI